MSVIDRLVQRAVCLAPVARRVTGCRIGTRRGISIRDLAERLGPPHEAAPEQDWNNYSRPLLDEQGKVSAIWYIDTPRGPVEVRDYWWNARDELSVAGADNRALRWVHRWMDLHGLGRRA